MDHARTISDRALSQRHVYCVRFINRRSDAEDVLMIEAANDEEAMKQARSIRMFTTREIWNGHRLVAVIPTIN